MWERKKRGGDFWSDRLEEKHKGIGEENNCNQGCPGMILTRILTHTWFLRVFVSEHLIYWWLVWTERATNWFLEIGYSLLCPVLDSDSLMCHCCLLKFMTHCLNLIMFFFFVKNPILHCSLCPQPTD